MKAFYYEFFHIPEQGKIQDKVLMARVVLAAVLIILCMLAMSLSAYAFYAVGLSTHSTIRTAHFAAQLEILDGAENPVDYETQNGVHQAELQPDSYTVRLSYGGDAETGFCVIRLNDQQYHTRQFFAENWATDELVLMLELYEPSELTVVPHWGTSSCYETFSENGDVETITVGTAPEEETEELSDSMEETEEEMDLMEQTEEETGNTEEFAEEQEAEATEEEDPLEDTVDLVQQAQQEDPIG